MTELPDDILELQQLAFRYFLDHTNASNGLVADNTRPHRFAVQHCGHRAGIELSSGRGEQRLAQARGGG